jgi:hypothetical protein
MLRPHVSTRLRTVALLGVVAGCGVARRASVNVVDTQLRAQGQVLDRGEGRGPTRIGDYEIVSLSVTPTQVDPQGPLVAGDVHRPIVQHHLQMQLRAPTGEQWGVQCISQRRQGASSDYAAVAGINKDDVAVRCELQSTDRHWTFVTEAELGVNFQGRLSGPQSSLDVEIMTYVQRFGWMRRPLPDPVAQVRRGDEAVAAMLLGRPEQAWVARGLSPEIAGPSIATMLALRHLPLGLDG